MRLKFLDLSLSRVDARNFADLIDRFAGVLDDVFVEEHPLFVPQIDGPN